MARKINKSVEVGLPNTPFGQHSILQHEQTVDRNSISTQERILTGTKEKARMGRPSVSSCQMFQMILSTSLLGALWISAFEKNSTAFFEDPYSAVMNFDEGYEKISLAVMESGSNVHIPLPLHWAAD